ncbi:MAG: hypothetical protein K2Y08_05575 [Alphaproteobacteria bacterium]|nr:hypothetical protein [Alphaproteobacteria bacterium]
MRNKFLKMTFMALCLSTSSALHAMNPEDEVASCSSAISPYVGEYEIRRNDPYEQSSGSVTIRQDGDSLILENFSLIPGSYYHDHVEEECKVPFEMKQENPDFDTDSNRIAHFILALPNKRLQLKYLFSDEERVQYLGETNFGEFRRMLRDIEDETFDTWVPSRIWVRFQREKYSYSGEIFTLTVESPYTFAAASCLQPFRLFKVESAEHERLLRPWPAPAAEREEDRTSVLSSPNLAGSSSQIEPEVIRPSVKLNPGSFDLVRDDIKGRGLMTPFSFNSPEEGSFKVSGEGTLFYQVLSKPLMDSFVGQKLLLEAEIKSETAGGYLQYFNGIDRIMSYPYSGENGWQKLQLEFTVKDGSRCHIIYPLVMPPQTPGSDIPVVEIRNINLNFAS